MSNEIPEELRQYLPDFDTDKYQYTWGESEADWGKCEWFDNDECEWRNTPEVSGFYIHRRPKTQYILVPFKERREGDEWQTVGEYREGVGRFYAVTSSEPHDRAHAVIRRKITE